MIQEARGWALTGAQSLQWGVFSVVDPVIDVVWGLGILFFDQGMLRQYMEPFLPRLCLRSNICSPMELKNNQGYHLLEYSLFCFSKSWRNNIFLNSIFTDYSIETTHHWMPLTMQSSVHLRRRQDFPIFRWESWGKTDALGQNHLIKMEAEPPSPGIGSCLMFLPPHSTSVYPRLEVPQAGAHKTLCASWFLMWGARSGGRKVAVWEQMLVSQGVVSCGQSKLESVLISLFSCSTLGASFSSAHQSPQCQASPYLGAERGTTWRWAERRLSSWYLEVGELPGKTERRLWRCRGQVGRRGRAWTVKNKRWRGWEEGEQPKWGFPQ